MRFLHSIVSSLLLVGASVASSIPAWGFDDAVISVSAKGNAGNAFRDKLSDHVPLTNSITMGVADTLKILLTATESGKAKRPHQAFLLLRDQDTGLEAPFAFSVKENGKGKVDFSQKDIPIQLLRSSQHLRATLVIASFGTSNAFSNHVFNLELKADPKAPLLAYEKPLRYEKREDINHIFKADPKSGPKVISLFFALAVLATVPVLFGAWSYLGANISHLSKATAAAPVAHGLFFGSIVSMEGIFFLYYCSWSLFRTLPFAAVIGLVAFLSGSKALSEVQSRRLAGER